MVQACSLDVGGLPRTGFVKSHGTLGGRVVTERGCESNGGFGTLVVCLIVGAVLLGVGCNVAMSSKLALALKVIGGLHLGLGVPFNLFRGCTSQESH